jgi:hypothetical protein
MVAREKKFWKMKVRLLPSYPRRISLTTGKIFLPMWGLRFNRLLS